MTDMPPPGAPPSTGGGLNKKLWGLPTWGWIAIAAAAGIGGFVWLQSRKKSSDDSSTDTTSDDSSVTNAGYSSDVDQGLLAQIRDLQGDTSTPTAATPTAGQVGSWVAKPSKTSIYNTFTGASNAVRYHITLNGREWNDIGGSPFTISGLKANTPYTIGIQAVNKDGRYGAISTKVVKTTTK